MLGILFIHLESTLIIYEKSVHTVPGGPYSKIPLGGLTPIALNKLG